MKLGIYAVVVAAVAMSCQKKSSGSDDVAPQVENAPSGEQEQNPAPSEQKNPAPSEQKPAEIPAPSKVMDATDAYISSKFPGLSTTDHATLREILVECRRLNPDQDISAHDASLSDYLDNKQIIADVIKDRYVSSSMTYKLTEEEQQDLLTEFAVWLVTAPASAMYPAYSVQMFDEFMTAN